MINKDLLRRTLAYIETNPDEWDQEKWVCGTVACFAGRACLLSGYEPCNFSGDRVSPIRDDEGRLIDDGETGLVRRDGQIDGVEWAARNLLGLDEEQGDELFDMGNDLDDLRKVVASLCDS